MSGKRKQSGIPPAYFLNKNHLPQRNQQVFAQGSQANRPFQPSVNHNNVQSTPQFFNAQHQTNSQANRFVRSQSVAPSKERAEKAKRAQTPSVSSHYNVNSKQGRQMERGQTPTHREAAPVIDQRRQRDEQGLNRDARLERGRTSYNHYQEQLTPRRSNQMGTEQASYNGYQGANTPRRNSQMDYKRTSYNTDQRAKTPVTSSYMDREQSFGGYAKMGDQMRSEQTPSRDVNYRKGLTSTNHTPVLFTGNNNYHQEAMTNRAKTPFENNNHEAMPKINIQLNHAKTSLDGNNGYEVNGESKWQQSNFVEIEHGLRREKSIPRQGFENSQTMQDRNRFENDAELNQANDFNRQTLQELFETKSECESWKNEYYKVLKQMDDLKNVHLTQVADHNLALENNHNEQINILNQEIATMNQELATKNRELFDLKGELQTQKDLLSTNRSKHDYLKEKYNRVCEDSTRYCKEREKFKNDLKSQMLLVEDLNRQLNSRQTENSELQLIIYELKSTQAQSNNSTVTVNASTQTQLSFSNGDQAPNASSTNQQRQMRPFPMPKQVKKEVIEEIDRKAETCSNQSLVKSIQNEYQSLIMNQASVDNASSNVNGQEKKKISNTLNQQNVRAESIHVQSSLPASQIPSFFVTDIETILSLYNPSLVPYVNGSVPSIAANSSKRKNNGTSQGNVPPAKRSK